MPKTISAAAIRKLLHVAPLYVPRYTCGCDYGRPGRVLIAAFDFLIFCVPGHKVWAGNYMPWEYWPQHLACLHPEEIGMRFSDKQRISWTPRGMATMAEIMLKGGIPAELVAAWQESPKTSLVSEHARKVLAEVQETASSLTGRGPFYIDWDKWK